MTDETQVLARVATKLLEWKYFNEGPYWEIDNELRSLNWIDTGNGMLAIFEAMQKKPEEVRRRFAQALSTAMIRQEWSANAYGIQYPKYDELTPILVARAAGKAVP